jgi:hypothetical protein
MEIRNSGRRGDYHAYADDSANDWSVLDDIYNLYLFAAWK